VRALLIAAPLKVRMLRYRDRLIAVKRYKLLENNIIMPTNNDLRNPARITMDKICMRILIPVFSLFFFISKGFAQDMEIYVSDAGNFSNPPWQILKFDKNGENPQVFIKDNLGWPQDIVFLDDSNVVLISNLNDNRITRYDATTGAYISDFAGSISGPTRMKIGQDNLLYVLQWSGTGKVKRYQLDGTFVGDFTSVGVSQSIGMDWDKDGNLYVSSYNGDMVRKFDNNGNDLGVFVDSDLVGPTNIWFDQDGDLLVSDYDSFWVKRFDPSGNYQGTFISGLRNPEGVAILNNGNILIGNGRSSSVKMFDEDGNYIEDLIESGAGGLIKPNAVVVRNDSTGETFKINAGLNDAWYNPATDGQGFFITVFPDFNVISLAWFTYDTDLPPGDAKAMLGDAGHRWITALGPIADNQAIMDIEITSGGLFDAASDIERTDPPGSDGTITLTFESCNSATVEYDITSINQSGVIPIRRVAGDNITICEALNAD
jgi:sugar lactone lactonase YvrE